jgi:poly(beta-D-mannuronate) lyase
MWKTRLVWTQLVGLVGAVGLASGGCANGSGAGPRGQAAPATPAGPPDPAWPSAERWPAPDFEEPAAPACARTVPVAGTAALEGAVASAQPGDCLALADGDYRFPVVTRAGAPGRPIAIRAANRGKVVVNAGDLIVRGSAHLVIEGLRFSSDGNIQIRDSHHVRLTRCRINPAEKPDLDWVVVETSHHVRIDHNDFGPKQVMGNMLMLEGDAAKKQVVQFNRIDHNHFHDIDYKGGNGWEAIRAGRSWLAPSRAYSVFEHNLFTNTGGDPEVLSLKSSDNVVRYNTMRASPGQFTLRHGNRNWIYGNHILGEGRKGAGGLRVYGADHKIFKNFISGVRPGILIDGGRQPETDQPGTAHYRVYRAEVVHNTLVDAPLKLGSNKPLAPLDCVVAHNVIQAGALEEGGENTRYAGNLVQAGGPTRDGEARPAPDKVDPAFDYVRLDTGGGRGPLTPADVGPDAP